MLKKEITPEEALGVLERAGYVWKVWSVEDVKIRILERIWDEDPALEDSLDVDELAQAAMDSGYIRSLEDATMEDWDAVDAAIDEALERKED